MSETAPMDCGGFKHCDNCLREYECEEYEVHGIGFHRRKGVWVYGKSIIPYCSVCGKQILPHLISPYCPNCGSKMVEDNKEQEQEQEQEHPKNHQKLAYNRLFDERHFVCSACGLSVVSKTDEPLDIKACPLCQARIVKAEEIENE